MTHSAGVKSLIDCAWGVGHGKHKKKEPADVPIPDPSDPYSRESLSFSPIGQDSSRKRYWVVDGLCTPLSAIQAVFACICADPDVLCAFLSFPMMRRSPYLISKLRCPACPVDLIPSDSPRVYLSTNPWKVTSTIQSVSSTREEYVALIETLKTLAPTKPKLKVERAHQNLIVALEGRLEAVDKELTVRVFRGVPRHFCTALAPLSYFAYWLTCVSSAYSGRAKRLSSVTFFLLKPTSGKRVRVDRLAGLIMFTTTPKIAM